MACDPNTLLAEAKCYLDCIPPGAVLSVQVSLLCNIAQLRSPQGVSGLAHWWRADSLTDLGLADGASVGVSGSSDWVDKIAGVVASQSNATLRPVYVASGINGRPLVRFQWFFNTNVDALSILPVYSMTADFTTFCVMKVAGIVNGSSFAYFTGSPLNCGVGARKSGATTYGAITRIDSGGNQNFTDFSGANPETAFHCLTHRRIGAAAGNQSAFFNAAQLQTLTLNGTYSVNVLTRGAPTIGNDMTADIAEILHYDRGLTDAEILSVYTNYLKPRYALP